MASKQAEAVFRLYQSWLTTPTENPGRSRDMIEGWTVLTAEPGEVDYLEGQCVVTAGLALNFGSSR